MLHILHDTFIQSLHNIITTRLDQDSTIELPYLFGRTGHGARFSLAMNTRTGKEIGHPSSHYCWDVVAVLGNCFPDAGIDASLYVGPGYATRARSTAAQSERDLPDRIHLLGDYTLDAIPDIEGNLLYPDHTGTWHVASSTEEIKNADIAWDELPFGPVIFDIHTIDKQSGFPASTLRYLVDTLERGEEPMEIRGRNDYSTVSGWKAFARWMQSYSVPLPQVQHDHLDYFPHLLLERRQYFVQFLDNLLDQKLTKQERRLIAGLKDRYEKTLVAFQEYLQGDIKLSDIRSSYFVEQKTLTFYKKIDTYLTHHYKE